VAGLYFVRRSCQPRACNRVATPAKNFRQSIDRHKNKPRAVHAPRASTGCCLSLGSYDPGGFGGSGDGDAARIGPLCLDLCYGLQAISDRRHVFRERVVTARTGAFGIPVAGAVSAALRRWRREGSSEFAFARRCPCMARQRPARTYSARLPLHCQARRSIRRRAARDSGRPAYPNRRRRP
jgi:hypothetical protein